MLKIKTNKIKVEEKPKNPNYPYFGKFSDGTIVLFTQTYTGMCVKAGQENTLFEIASSWEESDATQLENYSVTISTIN